jgi:hypothetical protein
MFMALSKGLLLFFHLPIGRGVARRGSVVTPLKLAMPE